MGNSAMEIRIGYRDLFEYSLDFLFMIDLKGNILDVNNVAANTLEYSKNDILSMNITDLIVEELTDPILNRKREILDIGRISQYNIYGLKKKNGEKIYLESHGIPLREDGEIHSILGIGHEITDMIQADQSLKVSEIKYKALFSQSPYGILIFDSKGNLIESNRNIIHKLAEYAEEDFTGKNFIEIIKYFENSEQLMQMFSERMKFLRRGKYLDPIDFPVITKNGHSIWLNWQSSSIQTNNEMYIQVIIQDITMQKNFDEKFQTLFVNSTSGIAYHKIIYDQNHNPIDYIITDINPKYEEILHYKKGDVLNKRATEAYTEEKAPYLDIYSDVAETGVSTSFEAHFPPLNRSFSISVISQKKGEFITIFEDISDRKNAELKLKEKGDELTQLNTIITLGNESASLSEFLEKSYDQVLDIVDFDRGGIYLYDSETQHNILVLHKNVHHEFVAAIENVDISEGIFNEVFDKNNPFYIEDFSVFMENSKELGVYSAVIIPLRTKDEYVGSLNIGSPSHQTLSQNELELLIAIGKQMGIIIKKFESEKLLKESEEKFRTLFENATDGILLADISTWQIYSGNKKISTMLGYSLEELKSFKLEELHPKESFSLTSDKFDNQKKEDLPSAQYIPMLKKDGTLIYCDINSSQIQLAGKTYLMSIFRDITIRKNAEEALKEERDKLRAILDGLNSAGVGIDIIQKDYKILFQNKILQERFGESNDQRCHELYMKLEEPCEFCPVIKAIENNDVERAEIIGSDNRLYELIAAPLPNPDGIIDKVIEVVIDITERRKAEQDLIESEEKFRTIAEQSLMGIGILQDYELKYTNKRLATLFDYSVEEMKKLEFSEFLQMIHLEDRGKLIKQIERRKDRTRDTITYYQFRAYKKTGDLFWIEVYSKIFNYQGERASLITFLDITDMKIAEQNLKESEEKFRNIAEQSYMGIIVLQDGIFKYYNERAAEINGYTVDEIKDWTTNEFAKLIHPDDRAFVMEQARKKQEGEKDVINQYQYRIINKDGEIIWAENFSKTINYEGRSSDLVMTIDITDKIEAKKKLIESEEQFRTITEQSFMGILIIQGGKLMYLNKAMAKISGYPIEEMLNWKDKDMARLMHPDDLKTLLKRLDSNREGIVSLFSNNSFRIINRDGQVRWLEDFTSKIFYQGKVANLISLIDITDKKEAEQLIIEENKRLLELDELRRDIITRVSHELKTPLTSIYGSIQILLTLFKEKLDEEALNYVKIGHRGSLRLKQLIDNLLDTSRLESKKFELHLQEVELGALITDCVSDMVYLSNSRNLSIEFEVKNEVILEVDKLRFRQVLTNLISNAIKNTPSEGKIILDLIENDEHIDIQVRDTGVGLTEKEMERLFEKFGKIERYGMDLNVDIEGVGLGLYISKEIVELHGGEILVQSEGRNKGSTFTVRFLKKKI